MLGGGRREQGGEGRGKEAAGARLFSRLSTSPNIQGTSSSFGDQSKRN